MKNPNIHIKVMINIVVIFMIAIFASFIPDHYHLFFGDWYCQGRIDLCAHFKIETTDQHRGGGDCLATRELYLKLKN